MSNTVLEHQVYPQGMHRRGNLDLMIADDQLNKAVECLRGAGLSVQSKAPNKLTVSRQIGEIDTAIDLYLQSRLAWKGADSSLEKSAKQSPAIELAGFNINTLGAGQLLSHAYHQAVGRNNAFKQFVLSDVADLIGLVETYNQIVDWQQLATADKRTFHAVSMLHLIGFWSSSLQGELPVSAVDVDKFTSGMEIPPVASIEVLGRKAWLNRYLKEALSPSAWWSCFYLGRDPVSFSAFEQRVIYLANRLWSLAKSILKTPA